MTSTSNCTCGRIKIGMKVTENRNWNPDCPEHGLTSPWWNSPEQHEKREQESLRLRELQTKAAQLREQARKARESDD